MLENVKTIKFNSHYVSGQAKELITNFDRNTYIIKGSTGIGGTTALLNYTESNCLIISPNVGMIKGKEAKEYTSDKQLFIYASSKDRWRDAIDYLENEENTNIVINTTPDQICLIRETNKELYNKIRTFNVFVDEFHVYTTDATFRNSVGQLMELIFNEWKAKFKLSTATPNYNLIDIPTGIDIDIYRIERENQPKKKIAYSYDVNDAKPFIYDEVAQGRLVVLFTNNSRYHKSFKDLRVHNLIGETLRVKLAPFLRGQNGIDYPSDTQLLIVSSSYYAGFDIDDDCSMIFVSEELMPQNKININNLMQAYGRGRADIHKALYINARAFKNIANKETTINDVNKALEQAKTDINNANNELKDNANYTLNPIYVNSSEIRAKAIQVANDYIQFNRSVMIGTLESNNFEVGEYDNQYVNDIVTQSTTTLFQHRIKNLLEMSEKNLLYSYLTIKKNLTYKDNPTFTTSLALEYVTSMILKKSDCHLVEMLDNKRLRANELYSSVNLFLRVNHATKYLSEQLTEKQEREARRVHKQDKYNDKLDSMWWLIKDWYLLYGVHKAKKGILPSSIEREILIYKEFYDEDVYNNNASDKHNRIRKTLAQIIKQLTDANILLVDSELKWLNDVIKNRYKSLDSGETLTNNNTKAHLIKKMVNALLFLWSDGKNEIIKEVKSREYHSITQLPSAFRCIIPIKYISVDLTSANPQIVDSILGTGVALDVYRNLISTRNITRNEAKVVYNSCLNNHKLTQDRAYKIYLDCGYGEMKAKELSKLTAQVDKGSFYEIMTLNEKRLMENYASILPIKSYRFHDAIIMQYEDVVNSNIELPTIVNEYIYHTDFFHDASDYDKVTNDKVYSKNGFIPNYKVA
ncbi:hypothetical protein K5V07_09355 [Flavobacterium sp. CHNK8]|uniref:hypothetical protein n=1 Tax=Flavobacterium sp. CHNK8 TaxID=2871165 RepID=UPI001C8DB04E|nr:hypothetical protein [Flavobacterium sp. CHNK8]QZK90686.1 hypothetical protein K5V07_09355 [Flavobacterium sp. CHNK8]